jgi:hypothetical protein
VGVNMPSAAPGQKLGYFERLVTYERIFVPSFKNRCAPKDLGRYWQRLVKDDK